MRTASRAFLRKRGPPELAVLGAAALLTHRWAYPQPVTFSSTAAKAVLVQNGLAAEPWLPKDRLLKDYRGAYTTARTVDRSGIFELSMHCSRLHNTASTILKSDEQAPTEASKFLEATGTKGLKSLVRREITTGLDFLKKNGGISDGVDYQVTLLFTWDTIGPHTPVGRGFDVFTFVQPLPYVEPMVAVEAHQAERKNPTIKDVQWVNDRQYLEEVQRKAQVNEVLMFDDDGRITEGLQTNFAAIAKDGALVTAPDERVLAGTVRKVLLEVAEKEGMPIRFECPNINDLNTWDSCLICSTSRLIKPVRELGVPELSLHRRFPTTQSKAHRLEDLVREAVRSNTEPLEP